MPKIYIRNARIVEAPASSGHAYYVEHPANDAILAGADSHEQAEQIVQDFNELADKIEL